MRKTVLLNSEISSVISVMGHTDMLCVGDCGLPIRGTKRIDLALKKGVPGLIETLETILEELKVEKAYIAVETKEVSPAMHDEMVRLLGEDVIIEYITHEELKKMSEQCKAVVRTGECTSYANLILVSGVTF